jgi:hypothetical protein
VNVPDIQKLASLAVVPIPKGGRKLPNGRRTVVFVQNSNQQHSKSLTAPDENPAKQLVDWLRDNTFNLEDMDDLVVQALADLTSSDLPKGSFAPTRSQS